MPLLRHIPQLSILDFGWRSEEWIAVPSFSPRWFLARLDSVTSYHHASAFFVSFWFWLRGIDQAK
jgi:hypothetical protein